MKRAIGPWVAILSVFVLTATACNDRPESPSVPPTPSPPQPPTLISVALTGNVTLGAVGETSQLTLTGTFSDGTSKDVSADARWTLGDPRVLTITPGGLATVTTLGRTFVTANYQNRGASTKVTATSPGTYVISGRVREPGQGGLLDAVITDAATGLSATSNLDGLFSIAALPAPEALLNVAKVNYEAREVSANERMEVDAPVQRIVRLTAGESVDPPPLAPNDLAYEIDGVRCEPCRLIRIMVPTTGDIEMRLTWQSRSRLMFLARGMVVAGDNGAASGFLTIASPGELVVYVGSSGAITSHTPFKFATTLP